ncbi:hypothetical protein AVEN_32563-1 [Araneus ventricosus]|uniref:Uncharacterized protein n=1 Tax=Araneus ventricosus TaxID=182803 RepID=A0A4Y2L5J1_ARAVE|nr:hypothetical protein AVEN_32563-1 [Araneus ventricosus]
MPEGFIFRSDGAPCYFYNDATSYLNAEVLVWIGGGGVSPWSRRSLDLTLLDFSIRGFLKDQVYHSPLRRSIPELKSRITTTLFDRREYAH